MSSATDRVLLGNCEWLDFHGCYDSGWGDLIVPAAFAHPAKMARGLVRRIFDHMFQRGYVAKGSRVVDPFGGVGTTGIEGASRGLEVVCVELEPRFHALMLESFALHRRTWELSGDPLPVGLCGDSRRLVELVGGAEACVGSPPFMESLDRGNVGKAERVELARSLGISNAEHISQIDMERIGKRSQGDYGTTPGQLGALPPGSIDAALGSPPYATDVVHDRNGINVSKCERPGTTSQAHAAGYGDTPGQLGRMKAGEVDGAVGSPPFEAQRQGGGLAAAARGEQSSYPVTVGLMRQTASKDGYQCQGDTPGQLGNATGDTFWTAARVILVQCHALLRPGAMTAWVVKDFVRKGKRVDFCGDWCRLLESAGFRIVTRARAWLVKETARYHHLHDGAEVVETVERKSFFRRLAEKKGSPRIDWEEVVFAERLAPRHCQHAATCPDLE